MFLAPFLPLPLDLLGTSCWIAWFIWSFVMDERSFLSILLLYPKMGGLSRVIGKFLDMLTVFFGQNKTPQSMLGRKEVVLDIVK
jgi:hypothetical protein